MELVTHDYEVVTASSGPEAVAAAATRKPDLMILDLTLDDPLEAMRHGFMLLAWLRRTLPDADFPVIIHTADQSPKVDAEAKAHGVFAVFRKGGGGYKLLELVQRALAAHKSNQANSRRRAA